MSHHATETPARNARDYCALVWTVKSLADDSELEPFVEAIPDAYAGATDLKLHSCIEGLLRSCDSGLLSLEAANRRRIASCKALWAIASLQTSKQPLDFSHWGHYFAQIGTDHDHYYMSVRTLMTWGTFCCVKNDLTEVSKDLAQCEAALTTGDTPNLQPVASFLKSLRGRILPDSFLVKKRVQGYLSDTAAHPSDMIPVFSRAIEDISTNTPHRILFDYLRCSARLTSHPYQ
ncbi:hypothetical protein C8R44DRAFT_878162 [Mycena epipterygia]|nr:hypothetical protein C8R44DRAFT_878162 [Mycena epipterygia]